jgi:hypothetical protein
MAEPRSKFESAARATAAVEQRIARAREILDSLTAGDINGHGFYSEPFARRAGWAAPRARSKPPCTSSRTTTVRQRGLPYMSARWHPKHPLRSCTIRADRGRSTPNTVIASTFDVGRRFRCMMRVDPGSAYRGARTPSSAMGILVTAESHSLAWRRSGICGCRSPRIGWITAPGSSWPQSRR